MQNPHPTQINYTLTTSPFGPCLIATTQNKICHLSFSKKEQSLTQLKQQFPTATLTAENKTLPKLTEKIFHPTNNKSIPLHLTGTDFQIKVWQILQTTKNGQTLSYQEIANQINPKAVRAVATAIAKNKIAYLIPCHRIIRKNGNTGNYRWGTKTKQKILNWEHSII